MKKSLYFYLSAIFSLLIYLSLVFFIFSYLNKFEKKAKQYTAKKNNFIEITINDKKRVDKKKRPVKKRVVKKVKKKVVKKRVKKNKAVKKSSKPTVKTKSLKSLFSSINTKKYIKEQNLTKKANQNSRIPKKVKKSLESQENKKEKISAKAITKSLSLEDISSKISRRNGEYNKYIGKISDMLDSKWQETPGTIPGNHATVIIRIDKFGNFSYKIDTLSYNNEFNAKLENFLESLRDEKFPPYSGGDFIEIKINFKDE